MKTDWKKITKLSKETGLSEYLLSFVKDFNDKDEIKKEIEHRKKRIQNLKSEIKGYKKLISLNTSNKKEDKR